jgi:hypothetical protein
VEQQRAEQLLEGPASAPAERLMQLREAESELLLPA